MIAPRRTRRGRSRHVAISAVLVAIALAVVTSLVGRELVSIESLAADVQSVVLPQITARQQRAIWIESLRSAANVVLYAPDRITRHQALAKAEQLAANVTHADAASREALDEAWASIRLAATKADEAQRIEQQMQAMLSEADSLITDMSANLSSIVDDSATTIARMVKDAMAEDSHSPYSKDALEEVMAINSTSHDLLASLDRGRIILTSALSLETDQELASAQTHFVAIGSQLQARVNTLRGNSDYEYLPEMIESFRQLEPLFDYQRTKLTLLQEAQSASASAKLQLGVVRETLAADAAAAAETSVATIAASVSRIKLTAAAMVVILIIAAAVSLKRNWRAGRATAEANARCPSSPNGELAGASQDDSVRATVVSLESLIKAQGNLEYWRQTLIVKLTGAVNSALQRVAEHAPDRPVDGALAATDTHAAGHPDIANDALLPPELAPRLTRVVGLIEDVAAQTSLVGLKASLDGVRLTDGALKQPGKQLPRDQRTADAPSANAFFSPSEALAAAAAVAEAVTERVGTTVSEINAIAQQADRSLAQVSADIVHMVAQLGDQLSTIRDGDWQQAGHVA
jgi:hypothetical protein